MAVFRRTFELLAAQLFGIPEEVMESTFVNGLKAHIRAEIRLLRPRGPSQLVEVAQRVEDENLAMKAAQDSNGPKYNKPITPPSRWASKDNFPTRSIKVGDKPSSPSREFPARRKTDGEWKARREKGLCF